VEKRQAEFAAEIETLERDATVEARRGDHDAAAKALQRLASINAAQPNLLSDARLRAIRAAIAESGDQYEHRQAGRLLLERERAVADELKRLSAAVREFHRVTRESRQDDAAFRSAELKYREAVTSLRRHDNEWLAGLMVELDELTERLHDPTGRAGVQVERFVESVKSALSQVAREIRAIAQERAADLARKSQATGPGSDAPQAQT
jgi:hypothetical protein